MLVTVLPAEDADMTRIFEIANTAFLTTEDPIWPILWPETDVKSGGDRMKKIKNSDPNTTYLKAVDDATGEIVGMAKWNIWTKDTIHLSSHVQGETSDLGSEEDKKFLSFLAPAFLSERQNAKLRNEGNLVSLDICAVHPSYQRQKIGDALVRWGVQRADERNCEAVVESSTFGKGLYERHGFEWVRDVEIRSDEFPDRRPGRFAWLVRGKAKAAREG